MQKDDSTNQSCDDEMSKETYETIGRLALSYLNGVIIGESPDVEAYVQRAPLTDQHRVREILEEVVVPLAAIPNTDRLPRTFH